MPFLAVNMYLHRSGCSSGLWFKVLVHEFSTVSTLDSLKWNFCGAIGALLACGGPHTSPCHVFRLGDLRTFSLKLFSCLMPGPKLGQCAVVRFFQCRVRGPSNHYAAWYD